MITCPRYFTFPSGGRLSIFIPSTSTSFCLLDRLVYQYLGFFRVNFESLSIGMRSIIIFLSWFSDQAINVTSSAKRRFEMHYFVSPPSFTPLPFCLHASMSFFLTHTAKPSQIVMCSTVSLLRSSTYLEPCNFVLSHDCCGLTIVHLLQQFYLMFADGLLSECVPDAGMSDRAKRSPEVYRGYPQDNSPCSAFLRNLSVCFLGGLLFGIFL